MNKPVLLTGATGFLGSHLLEALLENDYPVVILKRSFSVPWRINHLLEKVKSYDVDKEPLEKAFEENDVNVVIHTATHYGRNADSASRIVETNLLFPLHLLEIAAAFNTGTFFNTDTLLNKYLNNYALSKNQFVDWLRISCENKKIKGVNLKIEHMYGPRDDSSKFVSWLLRQILENVENIPLTKGEQKRDFIYISDVVSAYLVTLANMDALDNFTEFEVGIGVSVPVRDFVLQLRDILVKLSGRSIGTTLDFGALAYRSGEYMEIKANTEKLRYLGWKPEHSLQTGLEKFISKEVL